LELEPRQSGKPEQHSRVARSKSNGALRGKMAETSTGRDRLERKLVAPHEEDPAAEREPALDRVEGQPPALACADHAEALPDAEDTCRLFAKVDRARAGERGIFVQDEDVVADDRDSLDRKTGESRALAALALGQETPGTAL